MRQVKGKYQKWASILALLLMVAVTGFIVVGCSGGATEKKGGESGGRSLTPQEQAQEGRVKDEANPAVLFTNNCGPCHGGDGSGIVGPSIRGTSLTVEQIQKQIENGAPADVFVSAGASQMDNLEKRTYFRIFVRNTVLTLWG